MLSRVRPGNPSEIRRHNRRLILQLIAGEGPLPRVQVARRLHLSQTAVSSVVGELVAEGLLVEDGFEKVDTPGRRAIPLALNAKAFHAVGVELGSAGFRGALIDLCGSISHRFEQEVAPSLSASQRLETAVGFVNSIISQAAELGYQVTGIGVSVPGVTNSQTGTLVEAAVHGWYELPLGELLAGRLGLPVSVENDSNAEALGEGWVGSAQGIRDAVVIHVGTGIGAGLLIDGKLHRGAHYAAGEAGFLIVESASTTRPQNGIGLFESSLMGFERFDVNGELPKAERVRIVRLMGAALVNISALVDPEVVLFTGPHYTHLASIIVPLREFLEDHLPGGVPELRLSSLGDWGSVIGAARMALETEFPGVTCLMPE